MTNYTSQYTATFIMKNVHICAFQLKHDTVNMYTHTFLRPKVQVQDQLIESISDVVRKVLSSNKKQILGCCEYLCISALLTKHTGVPHNEYCHINTHIQPNMHILSQTVM